MNPDYQSMTIRLPRDLHERLRLAAFERRVSMNSVIEEAVAEKLDVPSLSIGDGPA